MPTQPSSTSKRRSRLRLVLKEDATTQVKAIAASSHTTSSSQRHRRKQKQKQKQKLPLVSPSFQELQGIVAEAGLSYQGWEKDVVEYHGLHDKYYPSNSTINTTASISHDVDGTCMAHPESQQPQHQYQDQDMKNQQVVGEWVLESRLQGMRYKQRAFEGDRSHPHLKALDCLMTHLTYPRWPVDYQAALRSHYHDSNDWNRQRCLFRLQQKQCMHQNDRSHPRLVELDAVRSRSRTTTTTRLTYPGHQRDWKACESLHVQYSDDYIGNHIVAKHVQCLNHRQAHWDNHHHHHGNGNGSSGSTSRSGSKLSNNNEWKELDALRTSVSYEGCQDDIQTALEAHLYPCAITLNGGGHVVDYRVAMHTLRCKQAMYGNKGGDRSHPRLMQLDRILQQAPDGISDDNSNWCDLLQQLEDVHIHYPTDDWVGNAIFEKLLRALQKLQKRHKPSLSSSPASAAAPSTFCRLAPSSKERGSPFRATTKKGLPLSPSSSVDTAPTALNTTLSWGDSDDDDDDDEDNGNDENVDHQHQEYENFN